MSVFARWRQRSFAVPLPALLLLLALQQMAFVFKSHVSVLPSDGGTSWSYILKTTVNRYRDDDDDMYESFEREESGASYYDNQHHRSHDDNEDDGYDDDYDDDYNDIGAASTYDAFNNTNPHDAWCPYAKCRNSPSCAPCNRKYLFIVANGRSGSTTLLKMLNLLPGIRLSGENNGVLLVASQLESVLRDGNRNILSQHTDITEGAWMHNGIAPGAIACPIQHILNAINPPPHRVQRRVNITGSQSLEEYDRSTILGMKTIRIGDSPTDWSAHRTAEFFKRNFPCSRIIVNVRSEVKRQVISRVRSKWGNNTAKEHEQQVRASQAFLRDLHWKLGQKRSMLMDMKLWKNDVSLVNSMVEWLGFEGCEFQKLLRENRNGIHGYKPDKKTDTGLDYDKCKVSSSFNTVDLEVE